jgi:hypothetical protein
VVTSQLRITLDKAIPGLSTNDITITPPTGISVSKGTMSNTAGVYLLNVTVTVSGTPTSAANTITVKVAKSGWRVNPVSKTVDVWAPITFSNLEVGNGNATTVTSSIKLTFDKVIPGLAAGNITITPPTGMTVSIGALSNSSNVYTLGVTLTATSAITSNTITVAVAKTGWRINPASKTLAVYVKLPTPTLGGNQGGTYTTKPAPTLTASDTVSGCTFNYIKTTNGVEPGTPTNGSPVMASGQLQISDTSAKVKVVASKDGWVTSAATATQTYTINMILSLSISPASATYTATKSGSNYLARKFTDTGGQTKTFTATVTKIGNPSYTVSWSMTGAGSSAAISTAGVVTLGAAANAVAGGNSDYTITASITGFSATATITYDGP